MGGEGPLGKLFFLQQRGRCHRHILARASSKRSVDVTVDDDDHRRLTTAASKAANRTRSGMLVKVTLLDSELHRPETDGNKTFLS